MALSHCRFLNERMYVYAARTRVFYSKIDVSLVSYKSRCAKDIPLTNRPLRRETCTYSASWGDFLFHDKTSSAMFVNFKFKVIRRRNLVKKKTTHDWWVAEWHHSTGNHEICSIWFAWHLLLNYKEVMVLRKRFRTWQSNEIVRPIMFNFKGTVLESILAGDLGSSTQNPAALRGWGREKGKVFNSQTVAPSTSKLNFRALVDWSRTDDPP